MDVEREMSRQNSNEKKLKGEVERGRRVDPGKCVWSRNKWRTPTLAMPNKSKPEALGGHLWKELRIHSPVRHNNDLNRRRGEDLNMRRQK